MSEPCSPDLPGCQGHLGKYDNCLSEALHTLASSSHGWADEEGGTVEYQGYMWLLTFDESYTIPGDEWSGFDMVIGAGQYFTILATDQGFVYLTAHDSRDDAQAAFDEHIRDYEIWDAANDVYESSIVHGQIAGVY